jgi:hypothetical protein
VDMYLMEVFIKNFLTWHVDVGLYGFCIIALMLALRRETH